MQIFAGKSSNYCLLDKPSVPNSPNVPVKLSVILVPYYLKVTCLFIYLPFYTICIMVSDSNSNLGEKKIFRENGGEKIE